MITKMGCGGRGGGFRSRVSREPGRLSCRSWVASISIEPTVVPGADALIRRRTSLRDHRKSHRILIGSDTPQGRLIEEGRLIDTIAAIAKMNNTRKARQVIAAARDLLGGNGILLDHHIIRYMADIESVHTYEGTETIQTLIVGRDITGVGAFA
jgi:alkylation response protein AidB-like acyl-CoA dehydrogenase